MKITLLVILFLVGTVGGAMQALKYLDRRGRRADADRHDRRNEPPSAG